MSFSFAHGDGCSILVWHLCERLEAVVPQLKQDWRSFHVLQVKEKFGGLRFYTNYSNYTISALIEAARIESIHTCDVCGSPGGGAEPVGLKPGATNTPMHLEAF